MSHLLFLATEPHKHPTWADFGPVEWVALVVAGALGAWTIWKAVMYTIRPGEESPDHIKRSILHDDVLQARVPEPHEAEGGAR